MRHDLFLAGTSGHKAPLPGRCLPVPPTGPLPARLTGDGVRVGIHVGRDENLFEEDCFLCINQYVI